MLKLKTPEYAIYGTKKCQAHFEFYVAKKLLAKNLYKMLEKSEVDFDIAFDEFDKKHPLKILVENMELPSHNKWTLQKTLWGTLEIENSLQNWRESKDEKVKKFVSLIEKYLQK